MWLTGLISLAKQSWTVVHNPGAAVQATASRPAGGTGIRHVATALSATLVAGTTVPAAATEVTVNLRDGASGAGNVLWTGTMSLPATISAACPPFIVTGLNIMGSPNTAMTLEFSAAGATNTFEAVSLQGYDISDF